MSTLLNTSITVSFDQEGQGNPFSISLETGEKTKIGVFVHLRPVVDAEIHANRGSLSSGEVIDEPSDPEYIVWSGSTYGLSEGDVDIKATVFKAIRGKSGLLTVDEKNLVIHSQYPFDGIVKIEKKKQNKRYLWEPTDLNEEETAIVYATYEGKEGVKIKSAALSQNYTQPFSSSTNSSWHSSSSIVDNENKRLSVALTQVDWPPEEDKYPISLAVGKQDNEGVFVYQTPNVVSAVRGVDKGSLTTIGTVNTKQKDIYTVWNGNTLSLPDGVVTCDLSVYQVYSGDSSGLTVDLSNQIASTPKEWVGIVKMTTVVESKKLKWIPSDTTKRTQAVVHAYRRGSVSLANVEWIPESQETDLRLEMGVNKSGDHAWAMSVIQCRLYPALEDADIRCTEGGVSKRNRIVEEKEKYLEFNLVPLPEIGKLSDNAWEVDDEEDNGFVSKVNLGKGLSNVFFDPNDCFDSDGNSVNPTIIYNPETGNAVGDRSFYGIVKASYTEEYLEILYNQAYKTKENGSISILTGYIYAKYKNKSAFLEIPWDTNLPEGRKELYTVFSYYVSDVMGTWEYPDNWAADLEKAQSLRKLSLDDYELMVDGREPGRYTGITQDHEISPRNHSINERVHRSATYDFLGVLHSENQQPVRGHYYKPFENIVPGKNSSYKPQYFLRYSVEPTVEDNIDEFGGNDGLSTPDYQGMSSLYVPNDDSLEALKVAWKTAYLNFNKEQIIIELTKEFPNLIVLPMDDPP